MVFYRPIKANKGHQFAGLWAIEKIKVRDNQIYSKEIVHEWDLRIITEAKLAQLGGAEAYESYVEDNELADLQPVADVVEGKARTAEELSLNKTKLKKELKLPK